MEKPSWFTFRGKTAYVIAAGTVVVLAFSFAVYRGVDSERLLSPSDSKQVAVEVPKAPELDRAAYDRGLLRLAHLPEGFVASASETPPIWPAKAPYPKLGALLPFNRIVAFYGNFYSTHMGVLGEYAPETMLKMLEAEVEKWKAADPATPVVPAIDYIAVTAQGSAGPDGAYRSRMPKKEIDKALELARLSGGIVILEVQSGRADLMGEVRALEEYLLMPQVHLAIDPEFRMKYGQPPGHAVGTVDAADVNDVATYLAGLVQARDLPPKVLIVHRYTRLMVTNAEAIKPLPEVQIVMDMDGWGPPAQKYATYGSYIASTPVQFTGFKLFYKNDLKQPGTHLLTPEEILTLTPQPSFIQHQ